jgi:hypothetical protein
MLFIDVLSAMMIMLLCVIRCVDVTLIIRYMLWNVFCIFAERNVIVPLCISISRDRTTREFCCLSFMATNSPWVDTD